MIILGSKARPDQIQGILCEFKESLLYLIGKGISMLDIMQRLYDHNFLPMIIFGKFVMYLSFTVIY